MTLMAAKWVWAIGVVAWYVIRYPHERRSRKTNVALRTQERREWALMAISACGLGVIPAIYVATGWPKQLNYTFQPALAWLGTAVFVASLVLFYRTHKD